MNAWLLTWIGNTRKPAEEFVAIISARRGERFVAELMELLVLRALHGADLSVYYANRRGKLVYPARTHAMINQVPHGERIHCGHDPWLYGRKVSKLSVTIDEAKNEEIVSWVEPDTFRFTNERRNRVEISEYGKQVTMRRPNEPLSKDLWPLK